MAHMLSEKYARISENIDFNCILSTSIFVIGTGASGQLIESLARLGIRSFFLFDPDIVEEKNLCCQNFTHKDVGALKVEALKRRLCECAIEANNPDLPPFAVTTFGDFLSADDDFIDAIMADQIKANRTICFIMASDVHRVQARGNRIAIKYRVPTFFVGIYRGGKGAEIVFVDRRNTHDNLPCYRCVAESRYKYWDSISQSVTNFGAKVVAARSTGIPFACALIDAVLGHLIIGAIHGKTESNPHFILYDKLLREGRNLIQVQMQSDTFMGGDDIFGCITGGNFITFNTAFQCQPINSSCPDCRESNNDVALTWDKTDYLARSA